MTITKNTFDPAALTQKINERAEKALKLALTDAVADIQLRLDSGIGINGESYSYAPATAKRKGKTGPVDWSDTGRLRGSIGNIVESVNNKITGLIGVSDLPRGGTTNKGILQSLINRFPGMWGLSQQEFANIASSFIKNFTA